ncbi:hypothetical protein [Lactococcus lactis]|uniref:hypothetical protein n=1 Tax=Lactococcus lactis TaxID=1358 RepID=UPI001F5939CC|nr:hypothetical protein [Lactococcus lactis]
MNITLTIAIISFLMSARNYFKDILNSRMNLGVNFAKKLVVNDVNDTLFIKFNFINHSSNPITIFNLKLLDKNKQPYSGGQDSEEYGVAPGDAIPTKIKVVERFHVTPVKDYSECSSILPVTLAPYSAKTDYFSFFFEGQEGNIIRNAPENYLLIQTTKGNIIYPLNAGSYCYEIDEKTGLTLLHPYKFYKNSFSELVKALVAKIPILVRKLKQLIQIALKKLSTK